MQGATEKYKTAKAFRIAIADRLKRLSREAGEQYLDWYRRIAIDRFLARLEWSNWLVQSGYMLQKRLSKARWTKDVDISTTCHFGSYFLEFFARYLNHLTGQITLKVDSPLADF